eukprot:TRINITY_DN5798_c0_g1_i1.p1 TRINITY_DN5798_c0_g1~~TRINITY_DN5798_c0_g1_i1.p1  ORF type:complete len:285 (-),score=112.84 TRINITY_DN5798_c0_g1_i1:194-1048(-)
MGNLSLACIDGNDRGVKAAEETLEPHGYHGVSASNEDDKPDVTHNDTEALTMPSESPYQNGLDAQVGLEANGAAEAALNGVADAEKEPLVTETAPAGEADAGAPDTTAADSAPVAEAAIVEAAATVEEERLQNEATAAADTKVAEEPRKKEAGEKAKKDKEAKDVAEKQKRIQAAKLKKQKDEQAKKEAEEKQRREDEEAQREEEAAQAAEAAAAEKPTPNRRESRVKNDSAGKGPGDDAEKEKKMGEAAKVRQQFKAAGTHRKSMNYSRKSSSKKQKPAETKA